MEKRSRSSPKSIVLTEPLSRYTVHELVDWLKQENIPIPRNVTKRQIREIVKNSIKLGGSGKFFRTNPNEPPPSLSVLPEEITQDLLHQLPIEHLISFCSTSPKFSEYCRDSNFWRSRAKYIHGKDEILRVFKDSVNYNVSALANIMLERLNKEGVSFEELKDVFLRVINSGKLSIIRKMIEVFGGIPMDTPADSYINFMNPENQLLLIFRGMHGMHGLIYYGVGRTLEEKFGNIDPEKIQGMIETLYRLFGVTDIMDSASGTLMMLGGDKAIKYILDHALLDFPKKFDLIFSIPLKLFMVTNNPDDFEKYWNEYSPYLKNIILTMQSINVIDKYPFIYTKIMGGGMRGGTIFGALNDAYSKDDYSHFVKLWDEYGSIMSEQMVKDLLWGLLRHGERSERYLLILRSEVFDGIVKELLWLAEEDAYEEFVNYWDANKIYFRKVDRDDLLRRFEGGGVDEKYDEVIMREG